MRGPNSKTTVHSPILGDTIETCLRDPEFRVEMFQSVFADTGNPYSAWEALDVCLKDKKEIPDWLADYLTQCTQRMLSDRAKRTGDIRKILPWVFDFTNNSGPGYLLDPDKRDKDFLDRSRFALRFMTKIMQGDKPSTALMNARSDQERGKDAKTLRSWIIKEFTIFGNAPASRFREHSREISPLPRVALSASLSRFDREQQTNDGVIED